MQSFGEGGNEAPEIAIFTPDFNTPPLQISDRYLFLLHNTCALATPLTRVRIESGLAQREERQLLPCCQ